MLTVPQALALADRRQRRAVRDAAAFAASLGKPVRFLRRPVEDGAVFEAVALDSARVCAVVDEHGALRFVSEHRRLDAAERAAASVARRGAAGHRAAEDALRAAARPRPVA